MGHSVWQLTPLTVPVWRCLITIGNNVETGLRRGGIHIEQKIGGSLQRLGRGGDAQWSLSTGIQLSWLHRRAYLQGLRIRLYGADERNLLRIGRIVTGSSKGNDGRCRSAIGDIAAPEPVADCGGTSRKQCCAAKGGASQVI